MSTHKKKWVYFFREFFFFIGFDGHVTWYVFEEAARSNNINNTQALCTRNTSTTSVYSADSRHHRLGYFFFTSSSPRRLFCVSNFSWRWWWMLFNIGYPLTVDGGDCVLIWQFFPAGPDIVNLWHVETLYHCKGDWAFKVVGLNPTRVICLGFCFHRARESTEYTVLTHNIKFLICQKIIYTWIPAKCVYVFHWSSGT